MAASGPGADGIQFLYYGAGWPTNIGNAFIDLGAMAVLRMAAPQAEIAFASEMPRWFFGPGARKSSVLRFRRGVARRVMEKALDVAAVTQCDLVVIAGMAMCEEFITVNGPSVQALANRGVPLLLLGTGALTYSAQERSRFGAFLRQLDPIGFLSRDGQSYEMFSGFVGRARQGIDCAFFVAEAYRPPPLVLAPYVAATFDSMREPALDLKGRRLLRAHHDCWGPARAEYMHKEGTLISDIPYDYLALYAGAEEVHSDRVHACVAALAYGRRARLYHPTPRGSLFAAVGAGEITERPVQLDMQLLGEKKAAQVEFVRELLGTIGRLRGRGPQ